LRAIPNAGVEMPDIVVGIHCADTIRAAVHEPGDAVPIDIHAPGGIASANRGLETVGKVGGTTFEPAGQSHRVIADIETGIGAAIDGCAAGGDEMGAVIIRSEACSTGPWTAR